MEEGLCDSGGLSVLWTETFFPRSVSVVCNAQSRPVVVTSLPDFKTLWVFAVHSHPVSALVSDPRCSPTEDSDTDRNGDTRLLLLHSIIDSPGWIETP